MGSLSVAAFWAGAVHPRRQKHWGMPPPGASAPAFAPTVETALMQEVNRETRAWARDEARAEECAGECAWDVFGMSAEDGCWGWGTFCSDSGFEGVNFGIAASFAQETASGLQWFLISGGKVGNHCSVFPRNALQRAMILDLSGWI